MKTLATWQWYAFGSAIFASLTALFAKIGVGNINSNLATLIRTVFIIGMIISIVCWRNEWQKPQSIDIKTWIFLFLSAIATGLSWLCYFKAIQLGPISKVTPIDKLSLVFTIIMGILFLGEKLSWQICLGGGLVILGTLIIIL